MESIDHKPPAQKVTKEEIIVAMNEICEKRGVPVVRISDVSELESIDAGAQTIGNHLDELKEMQRVNLLEYGQKGVWWVPEGGKTPSETNIGVIDWTSIDVKEIPHEVLAELPEFQDQTYWQGARDTWGTVSGGAFFLMAVALLIEIVRQNTSIQLASNMQNILVIIVVGAFGVGVLSLVLVFAAKGFQLLEEQGVLNRIRQTYANVKYRVIQEIQHRLPEID